MATSGIITNSAQINNAVVTNAKIENGAITTAKIGDLQVDTIKVTDRAITSQTSTSVSSASTTSTSYTTLATMSFSATAANEQVLVGAFFEMDIDNGSDGERGGDFRIVFNGVVLSNYNFPAASGDSGDKGGALFSKLTTSGTNTLQVQARVSASQATATISSASLLSLEALK